MKTELYTKVEKGLVLYGVVDFVPATGALYYDNGQLFGITDVLYMNERCLAIMRLTANQIKDSVFKELF